MSRSIHQPIHPSIRPLLDPEYAAFHDAHFQYVLPDDQQIWDGSARTAPRPWPSTEYPHTPVASVRDMSLGDFEIRIFTPNAPQPVPGYPVFLWFHGGGWAVGSLSDGNDLCSMICDRAQCVVVTVGYRLAPEHPYPAAVEDAISALKWIHSPEGTSALGIDNKRIAIGGTSAGGNLAAVLSLKASQLSPPIAICAQLLVVPVIDNTASIENVWAANQHAPWLTPARMKWYRRMYLPNGADATSWDASPNLAPDELLAKSPRTWITVSGQDLLAPEAILYAEQLERAWSEEGLTGRGVEVRVYEGATHSILSMAGVLKQGAQLLRDCAEQVAAVFGCK
ncbi:Alpha/Beta hydrolase protein [Aspergillus granulosus]|uniref:Alpha/Beta hydrolase protein n=1 Tax=Aspergillus granulosus TaxID=176169 RepID=A0ABR4H5Z1_9EURO